MRLYAHGEWGEVFEVGGVKDRYVLVAQAAEEEVSMSHGLAM